MSRAATLDSEDLMTEKVAPDKWYGRQIGLVYT